MKKIIFILSLLILAKLSYTQIEHTFTFFGYKTYKYDRGVIPIDQEMHFSKMDTIEDIEILYRITFKIDKEYSIIVIPLSDEAIDGQYCYQGSLFINDFQYGCVLFSYRDLEKFCKGYGNEDTFLYERKNEVIIYWGAVSQEPKYYTEKFSIYPVELTKE